MRAIRTRDFCTFAICGLIAGPRAIRPISMMSTTVRPKTSFSPGATIRVRALFPLVI